MSSLFLFILITVCYLLNQRRTAPQRSGFSTLGIFVVTWALWALCFFFGGVPDPVGNQAGRLASATFWRFVDAFLPLRPWAAVKDAWAAWRRPQVDRHGAVVGEEVGGI